jgi:hypothetical protein
MANSVIGNQYTYNGPGYLDAKIQPVETVNDLNKILLRQRFAGLTVTVIHPDGPDSKPADYWLVQDPNDEEGVFMWERKTTGGSDVTVETNTPEYISITRTGDTYYVDTAGNFIDEIDDIKDAVSGLTTAVTETNVRITIETERLDDRIDVLETDISSFTETITNEIERLDAKDTEHDEKLDEIFEWHIEKLSEASGSTTYALVDGSGNTRGDVIEIIDEQYLESVEYIPSATTEDKEIDSSVIIGDPYLKFTWKYNLITYVAVKDWVNDYFEGDGISISAGHQISVKLAEPEENNQNYLSVDSTGLKMNMFIEIDE